MTLHQKTSHEKKSNGQKLAIQEGRHLCFTSENNPSKSQECKEGRNSPFSLNFRGYDGLSQEEKEAKVNEMYNNAIKTKQDNCNDSTKVEYYIKRGYSISDAKKQLRERQQTFSLEKCIEKYGPEAGYQRWKERQEKWQKTLDNLPEEEKKRILMEKAAAIKNVAGYSKISQELFNSLYEHIKNDYQKIYYATLENNKMSFSKTNSYEYVVKCKDGIHCFFLDFYVKDINKVIEFDGDYWHGSRPGNQERDRLREEKLNEMGFDKIYHVKERDYRKNPEKVITECLAFLKG